MRKFQNQEVQERFSRFAEPQRAALYALRELIFSVAASDARIGTLSEELRWGDPSYLTHETNAGSTIRLGTIDQTSVGLFFNCQTSIVEGFRTQFGDHLDYSKNRAVIFDPQKPPPNSSLEYCIHGALTYKLARKPSKR